jgi:hypothetical protein
MTHREAKDTKWQPEPSLGDGIHTEREPIWTQILIAGHGCITAGTLGFFGVRGG